MTLILVNSTDIDEVILVGPMVQDQLEDVVDNGAKEVGGVNTPLIDDDLSRFGKLKISITHMSNLHMYLNIKRWLQ